MSDLPDLDTSSIGFVAYWNAIDDGGATSIDPTEVTSASLVNSATGYDNGIEGELGFPTATKGTYRVKTDGWVIVYGVPESDDVYKQNTDISNVGGMYDIVGGVDRAGDYRSARRKPRALARG